MKHFLLALTLILIGAGIVWSQTTVMPPPAGSTAILCTFNAVPPLPTTSNQPYFVQCDNQGRLITTATGGGGTTITPVQAQIFNKTVPVAANGTYVQLVPASQALRSLTIHNNNLVDPCYIEMSGAVAVGNTITTSIPSVGGQTAQAISIMLSPGGALSRYFYLPNNLVTGTCVGGSSDTIYVDWQ
jgi:hypothetical protein